MTRRLRSLIAVALLLALAFAGCGFSVPKGTVWVTPAKILEEEMQGLDVLFGSYAPLKVRYGGGDGDYLELFYERWSKGEKTRTAGLGGVGIGDAGFTKRYIISLDKVPITADGKQSHLLSVFSSEAKRFVGKTRALVDDIPPPKGGALLTVVTAELTQTEYTDREVIPLAAFRYGSSIAGSGIEGPFGPEEEVVLVKARLRELESL